MGNLKGKVIVVTGAAGDIGAAIASAIRSEGGQVVGTDLAGKPGMDHVLDVTSEAGWSALAADLGRQIGAIDGLVNCAGIWSAGTIETTDYEQWRRIIAVNLDGTFLGCKHMLPLMKERGGAIVNVASVFGLVGRTMMLAYSASKGGVVQLTKSVALHGAAMKPPVRCNAICPGFTEGHMMDGYIDATPQPGLVRQVLSREIPLGRFAAADETAQLAAYLLSDKACFMTGASIPVDGGYAAR